MPRLKYMYYVIVQLVKTASPREGLHLMPLV
nr:MAG TPA: hypothetical protein [Caudoviricetes sp.]